MKWTRASEKLPEHNGDIVWRYIGMSGTVGVGFKLGFGFHYPRDDRQDYDKIEWLDESPESSVWPGEVTSNTLWNKYRSKNKIDGKFRMDVDHFHNAIDELKQWLQSRTAVKTEVTGRSVEESGFFPESLSPTEKLMFVAQHQKEYPTAVKAEEELREEYSNRFQSQAKIIIEQEAEIERLKSQPTAGGAKEEGGEWSKGYLQGIKDSYTKPLHQEIERLNNELCFLQQSQPSPSNDGGMKDEHGGKLDGNPFNEESPAYEYWRRGYIHCLNAAATWQSQPSPSNTSIKRPTEEEIDKAARDYSNKAVMYEEEQIIWAFEAAINWLLSIQTDK